MPVPPIRLFLAGAALALQPLAAQADSIDGTWCAPIDGRTLRIAGADFTTPGGSRIIGLYGRHDGAYTVPADEPGAGGQVLLRLMGEDLLQVLEPDSLPLVWQRCRPADLSS
ncbi:MAG: hypothetical protein KDK12_16345 [Rhodobacteraceae bacterium]|nr:hypothetical protein [Paracoccaceae bacterium]